MLTLKKLAVIGLAVVASAAPALAGTKYAVNIVTNDPVHPPSNPTLSPKSAIKLDDKGKLSVSLSGVTDGAGVLVDTSGVYNDSVLPTVDATTYIVLLRLVLPGVTNVVPIIDDVELPVPVDLKKGKGKTKLDAGPLLGLILPGIGRTLEVIGVEVWGPLGGQAAACQAVVGGSPPASLTTPDAACRGGSQIGMSGLAIPLVAP